MPDPIQKNRSRWNHMSDEYQAAHGPALADAPLAWGVWRVPESEVHALGSLDNRDVLEFGCGAAQWAIALRRLGVRAVGLDQSESQLQHAQRLVAAAGITVPLVKADAERSPFPDESFDVVFCDHGALTFARPRQTVPEAARLLRPGGIFAFCASTPLRDLCWDETAETTTRELKGDYFDMYELDDPESVTYQLPYGEWLRLFRRCDLVVEDLIELRPGPDAVTSYVDYVPHDWARRWPAEHIWKLSKRPPASGSRSR